MLDDSPSVTTAGACPARDVLRGYLSGRLMMEEFTTVDAHLETCCECQNTLNHVEPQEDSLARLFRRLSSQSDLGEFELLLRLGRGGMGEVYKARQRSTDAYVAIKVVNAALRQDSHFLARFEREMRSLEKVHSPHVVRAVQSGEYNGQLYCAMELIEGANLGTLVLSQGPLSEADAADAIAQAALGLQAIHEAGLVHRDVHPGNLLLGLDGVLRVADLGLVALTEQSSIEPGLTHSMDRIGTESFMAPEQWRNPGDVTARADWFSLGCVWHYLLTARVPSRDLVTREVRELETSLGRMSRRSIQCLQRMLASEPLSRPENAEVIAEQLRPLRRGARLSDVVSGRRPRASAMPLGWLRGSRNASTVLGSVAVLAVASLSYWQWNYVAKLDSGRQRALAVAVESLESQTDLIRNEELLRQPELLAVRLRLVQQALNAFEKWVTPEVDSRELVSRIAQQLLRLSENVEETIPERQLVENGANRETALLAAREAQKLLTRDLARCGSDAELELLLAATGRQLAGTLLKSGDESGSERECVAALTICDRLLTGRSRLASTTARELTAERSRIIRGLARIDYSRAMSASNIPERRNHLVQALERLQPLQELFTPELLADIPVRVEFVRVLNAVALTLHKLARLDEAIPLFRQAITLCDSIRQESGEPQTFTLEKAAVDRLEAQILNNLTLGIRAQVRESGDWETPLALHDQSRALRQGILDKFPWMLSVRVELAQSLGNIADTLSDAPDTAREIAARKETVEELHALMTELPSVADFRDGWALHRIRWMTALHRMADDDQAVRVFIETIGVHSTPEDGELTDSGHLLDTALGWALLARHDSNRREAALQNVESLFLRSHSIGGFQSPVVRSRIQQEPLFASVRERPVINDLLQAASTTPSAKPTNPERAN